jgi:uncharacterized phage protein (TIGR01671 family)
MRPIEYRAWDKEYNHMYDNAWPFEHLVYVEMPQDDPEVQKRESSMMKVNGKWFYFLLAKDVELMQYTGLRDKNSVKIFEGDIVQTAYDFAKEQSRAQVVIEHLTCGIRWISPQDPTDFGFKPLYNPSEDPDDTGDLCWDLSNFEVIGNVYEHLDSTEQKGQS